MAPIPSRNAAALEAGYPSATQEKASLVEGTEPRTSSDPRHLRSVDQARMGSIRNMFLAMLVCLLVSFGLTTAMAPAQHRGEPCHDKNGEAQTPEAAGERPGFSSLLGAASTDSLHEILHKYFPNRYRHGVWPSEHQAVEAVHRDDAALATKIVQLAKRQDPGSDNTTSTSPPPQETSTPPPVTETTFVTVTESGGEATTSTIVTVSTPPPVETTTSVPPPESSSSDLPPTSSESDVSSTIISSTSTPPSSTTTSPGTLTSASSGLATTSSLSPAPSSSPSSKAATTTSSRTSSSSSRRETSASTSKSSSSESRRMITSTFTSTLSGGEISIVTQTSFVGGNPAQSDAATSTRPDGSLQTNAAASRQNRIVEAVLGAALGGAMLV